MKRRRPAKNGGSASESQMSELLILPGGRILVHNLTRPFAELLHQVNPTDEQFASRITHHASQPHELPN